MGVRLPNSSTRLPGQGISAYVSELSTQGEELKHEWNVYALVQVVTVFLDESTTPVLIGFV